MKRILLSTTLILFVSSIAFAQASSQRSNSSTGGNSVADAIIAKEKQISDSLMKKDAKAFNSLVTADAMLNGMHGRMAVADFSKIVFSSDYSMSGVTIEDPQVLMIDKDAAIITYKSSGSETYQGKTQTSTAYATTVWVKRGGDWKAIFHQESLIPPTGAGSNQ